MRYVRYIVGIRLACMVGKIGCLEYVDIVAGVS